MLLCRCRLSLMGFSSQRFSDEFLESFLCVVVATWNCIPIPLRGCHYQFFDAKVNWKEKFEPFISVSHHHSHYLPAKIQKYKRNQNFTCLSFDYQIPERVFYTSWGVKILPRVQVAISHLFQRWRT